jgi:hypothetical protein
MRACDFLALLPRLLGQPANSLQNSIVFPLFAFYFLLSLLLFIRAAQEEE